MALRVGHGAGLICAHRGSDRCAACSFLYSVMHAGNYRKTHAHIKSTNKKHQKKRTNQRKLNGGGSTLVGPYSRSQTGHGLVQPHHAGFHDWSCESAGYRDARKKWRIGISSRNLDVICGFLS